MKHLFVTNDFPPKTGGIESYLTALCEGFDPAAVTVIAPSREGHEAIDRGLPYTVVRAPGSYLRASRAVRQLVERVSLERDPDAIHFLQALPLGRLAKPVKDATRLPTTVVAHGSGDVLVPNRMPFVRRSLRNVLTDADVVFAVSAYTARAVDRISKGRTNIAILEPAVDVDRFSLDVSGSEVRERHGLGSRFVVLFVSRLVKRKGADTLVRAMQPLKDAVAVVVGTGPEEGSLKRAVLELELDDKVVFAGFVPDEQLPAYYAAADVFCMPCSDRFGGLETEGFGIVYTEAAAAGLPSVAGVCGGSVEAVRDGETGIVLRDPSPVDVAKALKRLQTDEALRIQMGAAARAFALSLRPERQAVKLEEALIPIVDAAAAVTD